MSAPAACVVIAAYNAERTLPAVLQACLDQDFEGELEILVVDDGSTDGTRRIAEETGVRVITQDNRGPSAARNRGWKETRAPVVLFTDSDCVPRRGWVRRLVAGLDDEHAVAGGSYGIANPGAILPETVHAEIVWRHSRLGEEIEFAGSYNLAARREALERVGGFDESYTSPSGEDNDLSYRLRDAGFSIRFVRDAIVDHHHPESWGGYLREQARHGLWRVVLYAEHPRRVRGDGYAGPSDLIAPPLAAASVACALAAPFSGLAAAGAPLCFALVILIHEVLALRVARHAGSRTPLALIAVGTLRAYARAWGMMRGIVRVIFGGRR